VAFGVLSEGMEGSACGVVFGNEPRGIGMRHRHPDSCSALTADNILCVATYIGENIMQQPQCRYCSNQLTCERTVTV
jgi:hypothetical protein